MKALAIDLPGHGSDPGPQTDLHGDADRVRATLDRIEGPVVLLGHSYGGAVITEAGAHPAVAHLVYLCALVLDEGESCASAAAAEAETAQIVHDGRPNLNAGIIADENGAGSLDPAVAAACFYNDCDAETVEWALARLGPQPLITLQQNPAAVAWRDRPSTYVVCANDMGIHPDLQRILARRCTDSVEWYSDHSPFLSQPDRLADTLRDLVLASVRSS